MRAKIYKANLINWSIDMSLITISFYEFLLFFVIISNYDVFKLNEKERMLFSSERLSDYQISFFKTIFHGDTLSEGRGN